ncbi:hypothetical protein OG689_10995 [Kitasatospora sp. NBC_00240]|uniref:hypothetical protein n=1 Tax=Kitasatospora sp. NBC_00240 TaxID=2903567 RepID=UPI0022518C6C|nr:hypothetical protein [Kitasatospora sp. NBC_00240]MCX5209811.1 hypothetical protein [Kitasatospora sp. NBC_00240]
MALPNVDVLFGETPEAPALTKGELSTRFDNLMSAIDNVPSRTLGPQDVVNAFQEGRGIDFTPQPTNAFGMLSKTLQAPELVKGMSADALASVTEALTQLKSQQPDLVKDLSLTSPLASGLVAFDLEAPSKLIAPRPTPLRNRIARRKGIGTSHRFKVISGFTGTGTGGVGNIHPGIADTTQTNFAPSGAGNSLYYARGPKISYAGYDKTVPYSQFSVSDQVTWSAQYAGQGFQDIRQLSRTSLLYSSMLLEERMLLMGRGTASGFLGALAAPTGLALTARSAGAGETAITGVSTNIYVKVTSDAGDFGQSVLTSAVNVAPSTQVVDVTCTLPAGATGVRVYVSTGSSDPGDAARWYAGRSGTSTFTIQGALPTAGTAASTVVADTSAYANGYDGMLAVCTGSESGYVNRLNSALSTANPGSEFQTAFAALYDAVKADPDRVLMNGSDRKQLSDALKSGAANNGYRINLTQNELTGVTLGDVVTSLVNEVTGKTVAVEVHPWMPQGNAPIISDTLPIPDTEISDVWAVYNVQDLMGIDWPVNQFAFESSSYWFGTLLCYAPGFNGAVTGIKKV